MVRHHVIWHMLDGHGFRWNMLLICKTCHALETMGTRADMAKIYLRCFWYMLAEYGLLFLLQPELRQRWVEPVVERLPTLDSLSQLLCLCRIWDSLLKNAGQFGYWHEMHGDYDYAEELNAEDEDPPWNHHQVMAELIMQKANSVGAPATQFKKGM